MCSVGSSSKIAIAGRVRAATAMVACGAMAAAAIAYWPSGSHRPVQVATAPGGTALSAAPTVPANNGIWAEVAAEVRERAAELTNRPVTAVGVATTARDAQGALASAAPTENPSRPGRFSCRGSCFDITGRAPHGTVLGIVFDRASLSITAMSLGTRPVDLSELGAVHQLDVAPPPTPTAAVGPRCTTADLNAARIKTMPKPGTVTRTTVLQAAPDLQQLSPPDETPEVTATRAWATLTDSGLDRPAATGDVQLLLGDLYSQTPATIQNYTWPPTSANPDTNARPIYTHTLVWALYSRYQPVVGVGSGGGSLTGPPARQSPAATTTATTTPRPTCFFESTVSYVDATTGKAIFTETFPPSK